MYMYMYLVLLTKELITKFLNIIMKTKYLCLKNNEASQNIIITVSISRPAGAPVSPGYQLR